MTRYLLIALVLLSGCRRATHAESTAPPEAPPYGGLDVELVGAGDGPAVILLHGYGTPPDDLVPFARTLASDPRLANHRFVMPAGRVRAEAGRRMWWPIAARPIREAQVARGDRDVSREDPPELPPSREAVVALVSDLKRRFGLPADRIALGGFSQGAMLAVHAALHLDETPGPVVALSGSLVAERDLRTHLGRARGLSIFISHGRSDSVLPFEGAEHMRDVLAGAGAEVRFQAFDGDHTIVPEVQTAVADFLADALPSRP